MDLPSMFKHGSYGSTFGIAEEHFFPQSMLGQQVHRLFEALDAQVELLRSPAGCSLVVGVHEIPY